MENKDLRNLLLLLVVGFLLYSLFKKRSSLGSYTNEETWEIVRDTEGNLIKIVAHRDATEK